uniref:NADH-ubiquinone oxidoreductase chain 3 n=1 Tax=Cucujoidea sp. 34 KM-2017 TaxID=2219372 RepID=A0A346RHR2_9CUCU|nr:NADH dehydrogenase subunit 3 [Cucujoidea sp. 34 KM-2017]
MHIMFIMIFIATLILIMIFLLNLIAKLTMINREKSSPFECGFDPKSFTRLPFSLHFFLITLIFLIFDIEIILLMPFITLINYNNYINTIIMIMILSIILIMGLYHEWNQNMLKWTI